MTYVSTHIRPFLRYGMGSRSFSSRSPSLSTPSRLPLLLAVATGSALVTAYFVWPDASRAAPTYANALLSPTHFIPATVITTEQCQDPTSRLITLAVPADSLPSRDQSTFRSIWSVFVKDDDIQVERPYTPLYGVDGTGHMTFWIKKYPKGEVGRWLHSKKAGDQVEIRGPVSTWPWRDGKWDEVVMISGGTGITPFYQLLHHALLHELSSFTTTRFTLIHGSRTPSELPPPAMLEPLLSAARTHAGRFKMSLYVDSTEGLNHPSVSTDALVLGRIGKAAIKHAVGIDDSICARIQAIWGLAAGKPDPENKKRILFLVCGPEPMIATIAGPFGRNFAQGAVGGVLGELGYGSTQVWKL